MATPAELETGTGETSQAKSADMSGGLTLGRARMVGMVTIFTLAVAVLGYLREATLAARFGLTSTMDAYFGAMFIPMNVYLILIVGTVSPILIPILLHGEGNDGARTSESFSIVTNFVLVLSAGVVVCGIVTAHRWLAWLFPGFDPATQAMSLRLIYIIFPAIPILALAGVLSATLNGFHKYSLAAFAPALSSIVVIIAALVARGEMAIYIVGVGTTIGFLMQFMVLVPATRSLGIHYRFTLRFRHPDIDRLIQLGTPLILYLVVANASLVIERNLASQLSVGALSSLTYATRLFTLPSTFLAAPLVLVAYPYFAREALRPGYGELRQEVSRTLRLVVLLFVPVTVWLIQNALFLTRVLYERGRFGIADSLVVSHVFTLYGIGILPNAITLPLLRCFYALEDTITPLWAESIDLVFFMGCAPFLARHFGISGLALTRGLTFVLVATILMFVLWRRKKLVAFDHDFLLFMIRTTTAAAAAAGVAWFGCHLFQSSFDRGGTSWRVMVIVIQMLLGGAAFILTALLLQLREVNYLYGTGSRLFDEAQGTFRTSAVLLRRWILESSAEIRNRG